MFLHWLILALVLWMAWLGLTMTDMPNTPRKVDTYALHKSIGLAILALMLLRGAWRLYAGAPRPVAGTPAWQHRIATATHDIGRAHVRTSVIYAHLFCRLPH